MSFRAQLALSFGAVVLLLIAALTIILGRLETRTIHENAGRSLELVAKNARRTLGNGLERRVAIVRILADSKAMWELGLDSPRVALTLKSLQMMATQVAWIGVADADGIVRKSTGDLLVGVDVRSRPWFKEGMEHAYVGDVHDALLLAKLLPPSPGGEPQRFVDFAAPIRGADGKTIGVLAMHGSWDWTRSVIESLLPESQVSAVELLILNRAGAVIYAPANGSIKLGETFTPPAAEARDTASVVRWGDGRDYLTAVAPLKTKESIADLGWQIVARTPKDVAYAPVVAAISQVAAFGVAGALIAVLLAWLVAGSISRPLSEIERAAHGVLSGLEGATIPRCEGNRELQGLSSALSRMTEALETRVRENLELARFDPLTRLLNRRGFEEHLEVAVANARRRLSSLAVIAIDIDHFKQVNDAFGHDAGDAVLISLAELMRSWFRQTDIVARMGGEEFTVLLVDTDVETANRLAQKLVALVANREIPRVGWITVSCGVSKLCGPEDGFAALKRADRALYRAKSDGRNRAVLVEEVEA